MTRILDDEQVPHATFAQPAAAAAAAAAPDPSALPAGLDVVCLCHLRWDFVFQRPQHLMTRFARERRVYLVEEPRWEENAEIRLDVRRDGNVTVVTPVLPAGMGEETAHEIQRARLTRLLADEQVADYVLWYYTPMMLPIADHLQPRLTVWDCMDELSAFAGAPPALREREQALLAKADLVFTGGMSLWEAKREKHERAHAFPSSIEYDHFARARDAVAEPEDMRGAPRPRIGFYGVVDERFDIALLDAIAARRPDWTFMIIGPTAKIDPATLPMRDNIRYLGMKAYAELPSYLAHWDVAMLPFARNESTKYISPTKTPEYLAAGKPVVSTSITDVVRPYGDERLVHIADDAEGWERAIEAALAQRDDAAWLTRVDAHLAGNSWDRTWKSMSRLMTDRLKARR